jgi:arylsulfatase A-like enzyme
MDNRPNILFIFTDQQSASMMSCAGNNDLKTPAMDGLAESGVRFDRAYCTNPVCTPSRFSLFTGLMPSEIGIRSNEFSHIKELPNYITENGIGKLLKIAGYDTAYGGKVHLPGFSPQDLGFDYICSDERDNLAVKCADYILQEREKPFFLTASFINPHDICLMAIKELGVSEESRKIIENSKVEIENLNKVLSMAEELNLDDLPSLPNNHLLQNNEPEAVKFLQEQRPFKKNARVNFTERQWRLHRWAYARLTEIVDSQVDIVINALKKSGKIDNTIIIFTSDHGDLDSAHKMEHKTALYEEACRVPMMISTPELKDKGFVDKKSLISNGLDLIPTIFDYAEIEKTLNFGRACQSQDRCIHFFPYKLDYQVF